MQHTKTPWAMGRKGSVVADEPVPEMNGSDAVEYYGGHLVAESVTQANAEFIVRACNAHDQLVAALKESREWVVSVYGLNVSCIEQIDTALAAAGAE